MLRASSQRCCPPGELEQLLLSNQRKEPGCLSSREGRSKQLRPIRTHKERRPGSYGFYNTESFTLMVDAEDPEHTEGRSAGR